MHSLALINHAFNLQPFDWSRVQWEFRDQLIKLTLRKFKSFRKLKVILQFVLFYIRVGVNCTFVSIHILSFRFIREQLSTRPRFIPNKISPEITINFEEIFINREFAFRWASAEGGS